MSHAFGTLSGRMQHMADKTAVSTEL